MAGGSGPVPAEPSVCLSPGAVMGSVTAGMAVMRPDVSAREKEKADSFKGVPIACCCLAWATCSASTCRKTWHCSLY